MICALDRKVEILSEEKIRNFFCIYISYYNRILSKVRHERIMHYDSKGKPEAHPFDHIKVIGYSEVSKGNIIITNQKRGLTKLLSKPALICTLNLSKFMSS